MKEIEITKLDLDKINAFLIGAWQNPITGNVYVFTANDSIIIKVYIRQHGSKDYIEFDIGVIKKDELFFIKIGDSFFEVVVSEFPKEHITLRISEKDQRTLYRIAVPAFFYKSYGNSLMLFEDC